MANKKVVEVRLSHHDDNAVPYYRAIPSNQLICFLEHDGGWHTATDDGCWEEPIALINMSKYDIRIVKNEK